MSALGRMLGSEPATEAQLRAMRAAAFHRQGIVCVRLNEVTDPALREAFERWAEREFGRRQISSKPDEIRRNLTEFDGGERHGQRA